MSDERRITLKKEKEERVKKRLTKRTVVSLFLILIIVPATIYLGWRFADRQYYITSLLIIIYTMIPFFLVFEQRKPQARELVTIAVLCAIAVASRAAFIWLPHFKPMTAIIMITGIALGAEAGFLTGAISAFASNFIFGQGPWTPWQMFAYGIAGFLAGVLFRKGVLGKSRLPLAIFGAACVLVIVGPILDTCAIFTGMSSVTLEGAGAIYLSGLPVNAVHAVSTAITLLVLSKPMIEKIDRVKTKYGMMED